MPGGRLRSLSSQQSTKLPLPHFPCARRCGHASWSTEKSVVTAKQAAAAIARDLRLCSVDAPVIPAAPDTPQLQALRRLARSARAAGVADAAGLPVPAPWASLFNQS
jgi:hypothetical protein